MSPLQTDLQALWHEPGVKSLMQCSIKKKVVIFGSSSTPAWDPVYQDAMSFSSKLVENGFEVVTGGYYGIMGAASRGAFEAGGESIGVVSSTFRFRDGHNPWLTRIIVMDGILERIRELISLGDIFVAMPGNIGTLNEIFMVMTLWKVKESQAPLFLYENPWKKTFDSLLEQGILGREEISGLRFCSDSFHILKCIL